MTDRLTHGLVRSCNNRCTTLFVPHVAAYPAGRVPSDQNRINFWRRENQRWSYPRSEPRRSFLFPRHPLAFLACLGERDGDRLFAAFHPAALSILAAFRRAPLITVHLASHFLAGAPRVFSFPFLSHSSLLTKVPVKVIQRPPAVSASRTATLTIADTSVLVLLHVATRQRESVSPAASPSNVFENRARSSPLQWPTSCTMRSRAKRLAVSTMIVRTLLPSIRFPPRVAAPPQITVRPAPLPRPDPRGLARLPANPVHREEGEAKPIIRNQCPTPFAVQRERRWRCV
jgi:hypothetical protein